MTKQIDNTKDYSIADVIILLEKYNKTAKEFQEFMIGQTVYEKDGITYYFGRDIYRFFNNMRPGL